MLYAGISRWAVKSIPHAVNRCRRLFLSIPPPLRKAYDRTFTVCTDVQPVQVRPNPVQEAQDSPPASSRQNARNNSAQLHTA